jgi:predicted nucleic acid-binding protein
VNFVLDNSVAMRWLLGGSSDEIAYASLVLDTFKIATAVVPDLWFLEASNVIAKAESKHGVTEACSQIFISTLSQLNIVTDKMTASHALGDTLNLARRYKLSAYDAAYLELALRVGLPLATLNRDLEKAAKKAGVKKFQPR